MVKDKRIEQIKSGDEAPLKEIYLSYRSEFLSWVTKFGDLSGSAADEVYHLTMVAFFENVKKGKLVTLDSSLKTYIFAIGKNKVKEFKRLYAENTISLSTMPSEPIDTSFQNEAVQSEDLQQLVNFGLSTLGEPCNSILSDFYLEGLSMEDLAERYDYKNAEVAKTLKYKCLQRLKNILKKSPNLRENGKQPQ